VLARSAAGQYAGQYAGSEACRRCHAAQFASHAKTGHARSLARGSAHPLAPRFPPHPGDWAFGAGDQAVTFVSRLDEEHYLEHGLSYYAAARGMALTPGHRGPQGERYRTFDPGAAILRCFQCHSTGPLRLEAGFTIQPFEPGVQCESCHGAGAGHAATLAPIRNPRRLSAAAVNDLCGACHRMPAAAGDDTDWTNPWNARHQPLYLAESACFRKSNGALSCTTCHPAHTPVVRGAAGGYHQICSRCHSQPRHRTVTTGRSCTACHMPAVVPQPHLRFANHWIGVYRDGSPLRPIARP